VSAGQSLAWQTVGTALTPKEHPMSKRARKRRDRKKSSANHGNRPNA